MGKLNLSVRFPCDPLDLCMLMYTRWVDLVFVSDSLCIFPFLISLPLSLKQPWGRTGTVLAFCSFQTLASKCSACPVPSMVSTNKACKHMSVELVEWEFQWPVVDLFLLCASVAMDVSEPHPDTHPGAGSQDPGGIKKKWKSPYSLAMVGWVSIWLSICFYPRKPSWKFPEGGDNERRLRRRPSIRLRSPWPLGRLWACPPWGHSVTTRWSPPFPFLPRGL